MTAPADVEGLVGSLRAQAATCIFHPVCWEHRLMLRAADALASLCERVEVLEAQVGIEQHHADVAQAESGELRALLARCEPLLCDYAALRMAEGYPESLTLEPLVTALRAALGEGRP
jgi:hypothetical protein